VRHRTSSLCRSRRGTTALQGWLRVNRQGLSLPEGLTEATLGNRLFAIYRAFAPSTASRATPGKCEHANRL
jgi:hypothetical protein